MHVAPVNVTVLDTVLSHAEVQKCKDLSRQTARTTKWKKDLKLFFFQTCQQHIKLQEHFQRGVLV